MVRKHLSYANVAASVALFLALAGGTTAIALRGGGGGGGNQKAGVLTSRITGFGTAAEQCGAVSGIGAASVGCSPAADPPWQVSPATRYAATGLAVEMTDPSTEPGATRTFSLVVDEFPTTALSCTVEPNESTCQNRNARVTVPARSQLLIHQTGGNGSVVDTDAMVSFRLARP